MTARGANVWQFEEDWPLPATVYTAFNLMQAGQLSSTEAAGPGGNGYDYDPDDPCPTLGGNNCCGAPTIAGPKDQRPLYSRPDVLSFTTPPLEVPPPPPFSSGPDPLQNEKVLYLINLHLKSAHLATVACGAVTAGAAGNRWPSELPAEREHDGEQYGLGSQASRCEPMWPGS